MKRKALPPGPGTGVRDQAALITYNAWLTAIQDNCGCQACQLLRQLTKHMPQIPLTQEVKNALAGAEEDNP